MVHIELSMTACIYKQHSFHATMQTGPRQMEEKNLKNRLHCQELLCGDKILKSSGDFQQETYSEALQEFFRIHYVLRTPYPFVH